MISSTEPLAARYDVALLDLDGVVYLGSQPVPGAVKALASARLAGLRLAFVTNNASRTPAQVAHLLRGMGVLADPAEVITSAHAAAHHLAERFPAGSPILVLGTTGLIEALTERGLKPVFTADEDPVALAQGYSPDLDWHALAEGAVAIGRGVPWLATNLDPTVPSERGPLPGNGALVAALRHATGLAPMATGKPEPAMHAESVQRSGAKNPLVVGDRLDTDIEGARRAGCESLLVLSGVTTARALLLAESAQRPDFLGRDVGALLMPQPEIITEADTVRCGLASVQIVAGALVLTNSDPASAAVLQAGGHDGLDPLRALAEACWRSADSGHPLSRIDAGDERSHRALAVLALA
jgi:HAD superfamily hydrolase (TIGR01450 family)